jgi:DNA-binding MarR family transcriptional regulator
MTRSILVILQERQPICPACLAAASGTTPAAATAAIKRLSRHVSVTRSVDLCTVCARRTTTFSLELARPP